MNKEIRFLAILFIVSASAMLGAHIIHFQGGHFPLTAINLISMGFVSFWISFRLFSSTRKDFQLRIFASFFFLFFLFMISMIIAHIPLFFYHKDHEIFSRDMHWGYLIGHIFLYLSLAVFIRLPLHWVAPRLKNAGSVFFLLLGGVTTVLNVLKPSLPEYSHSTGITFFNVDPLVGKLVALNVLLVWVPAGIYFIVKGVRSQERNVRWRALLLGIGLLVATLGGPLHDISREPIVFLIADIVVLAGIIILASGVMYRDKSENQAGWNPLK
ncbi:MAG: hypothetical protein Q7S70_01295 [bacterium]|nr:hypothetical protein [bacterium]